MRGRDPLGYYAALNVSHEASASEIRLAYEFLKQSYHTERKHLDISKIRAAYQTLSDPRERKAYDSGKTSYTALKAARRQRVKISLLQVSLSLLAVSAVVLLVLVGPEVRALVVGFESGDVLYWADSERDVGTVEAFVEAHTFPTGAVAPAYRIRPADGGEPVWYPARDIKRHARER